MERLAEIEATRGCGRIATLTDVRGGEIGFNVELRRDCSGRVVVRAYNEAGYNWTEIDLWDLVSWLKNGPELHRDTSTPIRVDTSGHRKGH